MSWRFQIVFNALLSLAIFCSSQGLNSRGMQQLPAFDDEEGPPDPNAVPHLFDYSKWPSVKETCAHCHPNNKLGACCCGICNFRAKCHSTQLPFVLSDVKAAQRGIDNFTPYDLFELLVGRTVWFIGDSQNAYFYRAVECFLRSFAVDGKRRAPMERMDYRQRLQWTHREQSCHATCLLLAGNTRLCNIRKDHADQIVQDVLPVLIDAVPGLKRDLAIVNVGLAYSDAAAYEAALQQLLKFATRYRGKLPRLIFKDTAMQHFNTERGYYTPELVQLADWTCVPLKRWETGEDPELLAGGWHNMIARRLVRQAGIHFFDTFNASAPLWYTHPTGDCVHSCHPATYELWTFLLHETLMQHPKLLERWRPSQHRRPKRYKGGTGKKEMGRTKVAQPSHPTEQSGAHGLQGQATDQQGQAAVGA